MSSLGWLRLLHQCLSVSTLNSNLAVKVLNSAASVEGLVEACCNLLLLPAPSLFTPNLERVLLQLGLHSQELGLRLIGLLLNNRSTFFFQGIAFLKNQFFYFWKPRLSINTRFLSPLSEMYPVAILHSLAYIVPFSFTFCSFFSFSSVSGSFFNATVEDCFFSYVWV